VLTLQSWSASRSKGRQLRAPTVPPDERKVRDALLIAASAASVESDLAIRKMLDDLADHRLDRCTAGVLTVQAEETIIAP
jgi:hypothetical protein